MISLCITTYNRYELLLQSFAQVLHDERISEIIIVDDYSDIDIFEKVAAAVKYMPRVKLYRNEKNIDCYYNKAKAIRYARNSPYTQCILLDSDNMIDSEFIDVLIAARGNKVWDKDTIYAPEFAAPQFNYKRFKGLTIQKENVAQYMEAPFFQILLNTCNYFVNRNEYLLSFDENKNPHTADTIYQNMNWLKAGKKIFVVPGLVYYHRLHDGSHYEINNHRTGKFLEKVVNELKALK